MKTLLFLGLGLIGACSSDDFGPAPVITDLTVQSPLPTDTTHVAGSVHVSDPFGLTALVVMVSITGPMGTQSLVPFPVTSTVAGQTEATVPFKIQRPSWIPAGTHQVTVSVEEGTTPSNTLTSSMIVE